MKHTFLFICLIVWTAPNSLAQKKSVTPRKANPTVAKCQLTESPNVRGFFLGQTVDEITKIIPNFREAYEFTKADLGDRERKRANSIETDSVYYKVSLSDWDAMKGVDIRAANEMNFVAVDDSSPFGIASDKELLVPTDLREVRIEWFFFKERLYAFVVRYLDFEPKTIRSFSRQAAESLSLPVDNWIDSKIYDGIGERIYCKTFMVEVRIPIQDSPHVAITNTNVEAEILRLEKKILARIKKEARDRAIREKREKETFKP